MDTTFPSHWMLERGAGPARTFFAQHRREIIRTSIISLAEIAVSFPTSSQAWDFFAPWPVYRLHDGVPQAAADLDRAMAHRVGENDNWIAGFCLYYRQPVISREAAFDRVPRLRRFAY
jgi:predicted nucleic acid-binding protein